MISYQTDGVEMPAIKKRETTEWIKAVAATYEKRVGEIAYIFNTIITRTSSPLTIAKVIA